MYWASDVAVGASEVDRSNHPFCARVLEQPRSLLQVRIGAAGAAHPADLVGQLKRETGQRLNDALLERRHVVEHRARHEKGVVGSPGAVDHFAPDERRRHGDRTAAIDRHHQVRRTKRQVIVDLVDQKHPQGIACHKQDWDKPQQMTRDAPPRRTG